MNLIDQLNLDKTDGKYPCFKYQQKYNSKPESNTFEQTHKAIYDYLNNGYGSLLNFTVNIHPFKLPNVLIISFRYQLEYKISKRIDLYVGQVVEPKCIIYQFHPNKHVRNLGYTNYKYGVLHNNRQDEYLDFAGSIASELISKEVVLNFKKVVLNIFKIIKHNNEKTLAMVDLSDADEFIARKFNKEQYVYKVKNREEKKPQIRSRKYIYRSPFRRSASPKRYRSPVKYRSPVRRSASPRRYRSPIRRRSVERHSVDRHSVERRPVRRRSVDRHSTERHSFESQIPQIPINYAPMSSAVWPALTQPIQWPPEESSYYDAKALLNVLDQEINLRSIQQWNE